MKVHELRALLAEYDDDDEILVATQPNYPITVELIGVTDSVQIGLASVTQDDAIARDEPINVWLVTGSSPYDQPYAPRACWEAV